MIPAKYKKRAETRFFLDQLKAHSRTPIWKTDPEHAEFYFNAFVSAGRSVTFALQSEAKTDYDAWFTGWLAGRSHAERHTLTMFNDARIDIVHRTGADLSSNNALTPYDEVFPPTGTESGALIMARMRHLMADSMIGTFELSCCFADGTERLALDAGRDHCELLEVLVADFMRYRSDAA